MTNNIETTKPSNRKLWFILAGISITVIGITLAFFGMSANNAETKPDGSPVSQDGTQSSTSAKPPTIETVETTVDGTELSFAIKLKDIDTSKWAIEYEVANQDRVVKDSGKSRQSEFTASVTVSSSAYYRIKVRAVDDEGKKTSWSENYTVKLSELEGLETMQPAAAYYETGWAKGTDTTLESARSAIDIAWNTSELSRQEAYNGCIPINSGDMTPTLLLPPVPSIMPNQAELRYMTNDWNGSSINITYLWCSK